MAKCVMILAGGTGGHVYPALAVARYLAERGNRVYWMGTRQGLESRVVPHEGYPLDWLSVSGVRGKHGFKLIQAPFRLALACCQAGLILYRRKPDVVLGMGGFVSGPGGLMAFLLRIPLVIHEQNAIPGTTNRLLARIARRVLEAFPGTFDRSARALCTGNPVRAEIIRIRETAREYSANTPCILVLGGSQGARRLNQCVPGAIAKLARKVKVLHQSGVQMRDETEAAYRSLSVEARVCSFLDEIGEAYRWADLVICRAGAMTISELAIVGLPAILVPFPYAIDDHQTRNAGFLVAAGAAVLAPEGENFEQDLVAALKSVLADPWKIASMGRAAAGLGKPAATASVAESCIGEAA
ncbi:MAG: undecaprenyldiphospho-muramoylpentapeptide beta-N-acetylglucosaminyltransferase [Gammaproteobacteria bacterium]